MKGFKRFLEIIRINTAIAPPQEADKTGVST
jgi:hypothetical protein